MAMNVIHITPNIPPAVCGVGDYASGLDDAMRALSPGMSSTIIAAGWKRVAQTHAQAECRTRRSAPHAAALAAAVESALYDTSLQDPTVILHYVGYGYQERGCPLWLINAVCALRARNPHLRLLTVFHELFATGRPWQSAFWLAGMQRRLAERLAQQSDAVLTNSLPGMTWLAKRIRRNTPIAYRPVFSTVGEGTGTARELNSPSTAVLFASRSTKERLYQAHGGALEECMTAAGITTLLEAGEPADAPTHVGTTAVQQLGSRGASTIRRAIESASIGFLAYPERFLTKSTVYAAYSAHAVATVLLDDTTQRRRRPVDTPSIRMGDIRIAHPEFVASAGRDAHAWYLANATRGAAAAEVLRLISRT